VAVTVSSCRLILVIRGVRGELSDLEHIQARTPDSLRRRATLFFHVGLTDVMRLDADNERHRNFRRHR
jgi:hypothetical protein